MFILANIVDLFSISNYSNPYLISAIADRSQISVLNIFGIVNNLINEYFETKIFQLTSNFSIVLRWRASIGAIASIPVLSSNKKKFAFLLKENSKLEFLIVDRKYTSI